MYQIGFLHPNAKSDWSNRMLQADEHAVIITGDAFPFAFGEVVCVAPTKYVAERIVKALNLLETVEKELKP